MLHRTTLGRHALEAFGPSRPNRVACNGCSVSQWDSQTSRGIKDLHMTGPRWGSPTRPWRLGRSTCIGFGRPSHMQFMPNALQACAGELARLSRLVVAQAERRRLCKKTTLRRCLGRAGWSLVLLALGPVRQQMLSGGLARGPAYGAC